ncbi:hypothetical protein ABIE56_000417 [Luteibacter sp. 621]|uniref:hypothetical protein n=1 Tax=Luteibacter sp. 621 TaxID=3373916 RepID=UPI003D1F9D15
MYTQNLCTIVPTQADFAAAKAKHADLKPTNVSGTMTDHIQRMLDNIDALSGPGSAKTLLDGFGVKAGDIASLDPDTRTHLAEKVTNRYMSAVKESAGDTSGTFADAFGNALGDTPNGVAGSPPMAGAQGAAQGASDTTDSNATASGTPTGNDPGGDLADILMRSVAYRLDSHRPSLNAKDPGEPATEVSPVTPGPNAA